MEPIFHKVTEGELPALKNWLEKFLPDSFKLYNTVTETLLGRWDGTTFCTLGWPEILAAGEGDLNPDSGSFLYHSNPRSTCVFSPDPNVLEQLLLWPGYLNWTQPIFFQGTSEKLRSNIERVAVTKGGYCTRKTNVIMSARQEDLPRRSVPEEYELRPLDPDLHADYILSNWALRRENTEFYIQEVLKSFPSIGLFDKAGNCVGLETGTEDGTLGMLHVHENARGRGLGKIITSQLAHKYFCDDLPVMVAVATDNAGSRRMHTSCGFKEMCNADWIFYHTGDKEKDMEKIFSAK